MADDLKKMAGARRAFAIKGIGFEQCNFRGDFDFVQLSFSNCNFTLCDFGYAKWERVKFNNCKFSKCSFTMVALDLCQFIDCQWECIGISGNETSISRSNISNPYQFIHSAWTNLDPHLLQQKNTNPSFQVMRLEQSKAKLARILLNNLEQYGDDSSYYEGVKTYLNQNIRSRIANAKHDVYSKKRRLLNYLLIGILYIEYAILNISGKINGWGFSIARPAIIGACLILFFGLAYWKMGISCTFPRALIAGFDVTLLFGYTKHAAKGLPWVTDVLYASNAFLGLWWYAVFVPTVINRISRVR